MGNMCDNFIIYEDNKNEFQIWQGLIGAHFTPHVDELGNLSWTNNGELPNPETVNVSGRGLTIAGIVATTGDLPETADDYVTYLVGNEPPYNGYIYNNGNWVDLGTIGASAGFGTPTATVDGNVGTPAVTITASGPDTAKVFAFAFSNLKGEPGQGSPATATPLMDGTAAVGSSDKYAREDHVHPLYNQFVRPNLLDNWYFVGGGSQLGSGVFPINSNGKTSYSSGGYVIDRWRMWEGSLTVNNQNITFSTANENGLFQYFDVAFRGRMLGKAITVSALLSDGTLWYGTGVVPENTNASITSGTDSRGYIMFFTDLSSSTYPCGVQIHVYANESVSVSAVKLELGDTQTLAHQVNSTWVLNELPNFEEQLIRCGTSAYRVTNKNLLDNWYFVGGGSQQGGGQFPINQRGQTVYTGEGYSIDRWFATGSCTLASDGISIGSDVVLLQRISNVNALVGKQLSFSVLTANGLLTASFVFSIQTINYLVTDDFAIGYNSSLGGFLIYARNSNAIKILSAKLELGSTQTLAHQENGTWVLNEIPDYEEQLIRCNTSTVDSDDTYANKVVAYTNEVGGALYFTSVAVSATTGDIVTVSNAAITSDHVLAECVFANPSAITTNLTWTSASGSFKLNGTCASATTCDIVLVKKNN